MTVLECGARHVSLRVVSAVEVEHIEVHCRQSYARRIRLLNIHGLVGTVLYAHGLCHSSVVVEHGVDEHSLCTCHLIAHINLECVAFSRLVLVKRRKSFQLGLAGIYLV